MALSLNNCSQYGTLGLYLKTKYHSVHTCALKHCTLAELLGNVLGWDY